MNAIVAGSSSIGLAIGAVSFMAERSYVQGSMFGVASTVLGGLCASEIMRGQELNASAAAHETALFNSLFN